MISIRPWRNMFHVASTIIIFASFIIPSTHPLHFNFRTFKPSMQELTYDGDAYSDKQALQLTSNEQGKTQAYSLGRAYYSNPVTLWRKSTGELANFTTRFTFAIYANPMDQNDAGDGLAFFLAQNVSAPPRFGGGDLGLFPRNPSSPSSPTVAVEFDTYRNPWDPYGINDHVGIDVDSIVSKATMAWPTSMKKGSNGSALVSYDSMSKNLSVSLAFEDDPVDSTLRTLFYSLDLRDVLPEVVFVGFSAATGELGESHKVLSWEFNSTDLGVERVELEGPPPPPPAPAPALAPLVPLPSSGNHSYKKNERKIAMTVFVIIAIATAGGLLSLLWFMFWRKRNRDRRQHELEQEHELVQQHILEQENGLKRFSYKYLAKSTDGFSKNKLLGTGGSGSVYRGCLEELNNTAVAVKKLNKDSKQVKKEFESEVEVISRLRHDNLVKLIGSCHDEGELLLVYELIPSGSLDSHLFGSKNTSLAWRERYKIAKELASALHYLHEECAPCVIHRDIKPSNVMLDLNLSAKLGDFGLARLMVSGKTTAVVGTWAYLAPEYMKTSKASKKSDVYSFGIVALEIACGRRIVEHSLEESKVNLLDWVRVLHGQGKILDAADQRLEREFDVEQMERLLVVGLWCAYPDYQQRPSIKKAIEVLNVEAELPQLPMAMPVPVCELPNSVINDIEHSGQPPRA